MGFGVWYPFLVPQGLEREEVSVCEHVHCASEGVPKRMCVCGGLMENEQTPGNTPRQDRILDLALVGAGGTHGEGLQMVEGAPVAKSQDLV